MTSTPHAEPSGILHLQLLGGFRVRLGDRPLDVAAWRRRKARHLFALLALAEGHALHRDQLLDALWPHLDPRAAVNNLHYTLHIARDWLRGLAPEAIGFLRWQGDQLQLGPVERVRVDVAIVEAGAVAARRGRDPAAYEAVLALANGELLPGERYEDWAVTRREALGALRATLRVELAGLYDAAGEPRRAVAVLQTVVADDPTHELAHRELMRLYARLGRRQQALRQYAQLASALAEELGVEPDEQCQAIHQAILAGQFAARQEPGHRSGGAGEYSVAWWLARSGDHPVCP
jgi:DNA-binding SARP family transcriptional activator